uniref:Uncharacterized protein n=1 Tax=mine drainage metagenome TaxID=410659 RepID=E6QQI6_9ZZZZ
MWRDGLFFHVCPQLFSVRIQALLFIVYAAMSNNLIQSPHKIIAPEIFNHLSVWINIDCSLENCQATMMTTCTTTQITPSPHPIRGSCKY